MNASVEEVRAMLALFRQSPWRDLYVRGGDWELFLAKPDGVANPLRADAAASATVDAPHLGLFFAQVAAGDAVESGAIVAQIEVLGEREDLCATAAGRVSEVLAADGALVEYGMPLVRIAA